MDLGSDSSFVSFYYELGLYLTVMREKINKTNASLTRKQVVSHINWRETFQEGVMPLEAGSQASFLSY